jgi:hypothetical protein
MVVAVYLTIYLTRYYGFSKMHRFRCVIPFQVMHAEIQRQSTHELRPCFSCFLSTKMVRIRMLFMVVGHHLMHH